MKRIYIALLSVGAVLSMYAADITVSEPGSLRSLVENKAETTLTIRGNIDAADLYYVGHDLTALQTLDLSGATIVAYSGESLMGSHNYDAGVIPVGAFAGSSLQSVRLGAGTPTVGVGAFAGSVNLTNIDLTGVVTLDEAAFAGCTSLAEVTGNNSLTTIGASAFKQCSSLSEFTFGPSLRTIGDYAFEHTALTELDLTNTPALYAIGARAFANDEQLTAVHFDATTNPLLGNGIFFGDSKLAEITLPVNASAIPAHAMTGVAGVTVFVMPNVESIGEHAMTNMTGLTKIDAEALSEVPDVDNDVWANVDQQNVELRVSTDKIADLFKTADQWQNFNITYTTDTGVDNIVMPAEQQLRGRFVGKTLEIEGADMVRVNLYDIAGRQLYGANVDGSKISIDTTPYDTNIYIVDVALQGGQKANLKLARR